MGSEMCIRDRYLVDPDDEDTLEARLRLLLDDADARASMGLRARSCLLYTSDAADERSSVDLGGRRIIKKKKKKRRTIEL